MHARPRVRRELGVSDRDAQSAVLRRLRRGCAQLGRLGEGFGTTSTYVISGDQSWYIDPSNDNLINQKPIDSRFVGLGIIKEEKNQVD